MPPHPKPGKREKDKPVCRVTDCFIQAKKNGFCDYHYKAIFEKSGARPFTKKKNQKPIRKQSKSENAKWRRKAKTAFQKYVRLRDADRLGVIRCITCDKPVRWTGTGNAHGGHFRSARFNNTCFDERNCNAQCGAKCNRYRMQDEETIRHYAKKINEKWGQGTSRELFEKSLITKKFSVFEYQKIHDFYTSKYNELVIERKSKGWIVEF